MKEEFLDTSLPSFKASEAALLARGYVEKKYTKSTQKEIEGAFTRHILPNFITPGMTPTQINDLKPQIEEMVRYTLYEYSGSGVPVLKYKMYIPGPKLLKEMAAIEAAAAAAQMATEEEEEEEGRFAPEGYAESIEKAEKAEKALSNLELIIKKLSPNSNYNNIESVESKTKKIYESILELMPTIIGLGEQSLITRANYALSVVQQMLGYLSAVKKGYTKEGNELANRMAATTFLNKPMKLTMGINKDFIEEIMELNNNNNNNNNKNKNKFMSKAMTSGKTSSDIKFIRDILKIFMIKGMPKEQVIELGIILGNLTYEEFKLIMDQTKPYMGKSNNDIAQQLYSYLISKKFGGRRTRHRITKRRSNKKRSTRRHLKFRKIY